MFAGRRPRSVRHLRFGAQAGLPAGGLIVMLRALGEIVGRLPQRMGIEQNVTGVRRRVIKQTVHLLVIKRGQAFDARKHPFVFHPPNEISHHGHR